MIDSPSIGNWFTTPIYSDFAKGQQFDLIQQEISVAIDDLKKNNIFSKNESWDPNTHRLSDINFEKNFILEYNLNELFSEIGRHVYNYTTQLETPPHKIKKFKIVTSWATQTLQNEYAHVHTHGSYDMSGVYYFKTNNKDGNLFFRSPARELSLCWPFEHIASQVDYIPKEGQIILFPGWLEHGTRANLTENERISISFNISFSRDHLLD
jgi:uncharacterized protein (TIGR02466 family)